MKKIKTLAILLIALSLSIAVNAKTITGLVVKVADGDTITILDDKKNQHRIRLANIDAPESNQPWGRKSKDHLIKRIANKQVLVHVTKRDRYKRLIGTVYLDRVNICREQIREGNAWVYTQYLTDKSLLTDELHAQTNKRGLWKLPANERIQPWIWRKRKK